MIEKIALVNKLKSIWNTPAAKRVAEFGVGAVPGAAIGAATSGDEGGSRLGGALKGALGGGALTSGAALTGRMNAKRLGRDIANKHSVNTDLYNELKNIGKDTTEAIKSNAYNKKVYGRKVVDEALDRSKNNPNKRRHIDNWDRFRINRDKTSYDFQNFSFSDHEFDLAQRMRGQRAAEKFKEKNIDNLSGFLSGNHEGKNKMFGGFGTSKKLKDILNSSPKYSRHSSFDAAKDVGESIDYGSVADFQKSKEFQDRINKIKREATREARKNQRPSQDWKSYYQKSKSGANDPKYNNYGSGSSGGSGNRNNGGNNSRGRSSAPGFDAMSSAKQHFGDAVNNVKTKKEFQNLFRQRAKKLHPDVNKDPNATTDFQKFNNDMEKIKKSDWFQKLAIRLKLGMYKTGG